MKSENRRRTKADKGDIGIMVHEMIHIICGNCGQDLTEKNMATWEYKPADIDEETGEVYDTADVYIRCKNCATIHFLDDHIESEVRE